MNRLDTLRGGLVVSVQPVEDGPLDRTDIIVAMAQAAVAGGASGLRIEGVNNVAAVRKAVSVPIIGIVKRESEATPVRITPTVADAQGLVDAGADIVALDMTFQPRIHALQPIVQAVLDADVILMADCATKEEGNTAFAAGALIIGTTLSGYTADTQSSSTQPDYELIKSYRDIVAGQGMVMAEGRVNSPELARKAMAAGADCVTVGSAITRLEHVTTWFADAIRCTQPNH